MSTTRREFLRDALTLTATVAVGGVALAGPELPKLGIGQREGMTHIDRSRIISEYLKTAEGREALGAAMVEPIQSRLGTRSRPHPEPPVDLTKINQIRETLGFAPLRAV